MKSHSKFQVGPLVLEKPWPKLHLLSDLHLDTGPYEIPADVAFDILVAAGDIGPVEQAIPWLAAIGKPVIYVLGNHERYGTDLDEPVLKAKHLAQGTQVHVLERDSIVIDGMRFLGTTLWTDFGELSARLVEWSLRKSNDFWVIKSKRYAQKPLRNRVARLCRQLGCNVPEQDDFHPVIAYFEYKSNLAWLDEQLNVNFNGPTVVVTHHAPTFESLRAFGINEELLDPKNWGYRDDDLMRVGNYASNLSPFLKSHAEHIELWCHGHLHHGIDVLDSGVRVLCNPRGYHEKPLTAKSAAAGSFFGSAELSESDIIRSQAAYAKAPYKGDALKFDPHLVIDLTEGFGRPLSKCIKEPLPTMHRLHNDAKRIAPYLSLDETVPAACVREVFSGRCTTFSLEIKRLLEKHAIHLDRYAAGNMDMLCSLSHPAPIPFEPFVFPGRAFDLNRDYLAQLGWMESWIAWTRLLPFAANAALQKWQVLANQAIAALSSAGMVAIVEPPSRLALRWVDALDRRISIFVPTDADIERASAVLERVLNQGKFPRRHLIRVDNVENIFADEPETLRRARALQGAIRLSHPPTRDGREFHEQKQREWNLEDAKTDATVDEVLRSASERSGRPMSTDKSIREGAEFLAQMRKNAAVALLSRIERKELISENELLDRLGISRRSIAAAVESGSLFAIVGPAGDNYYPAFFADLAFDRRALGKVVKALGTLPVAVKYHFFTSRSHHLGNVTPLEALLEGRLNDVLVAATGFAER